MNMTQLTLAKNIGSYFHTFTEENQMYTIENYTIEI